MNKVITILTIIFIWLDVIFTAIFIKNLEHVFYEGCKTNGIDHQTIIKELSN